jgi:hypothetical protein
MTFHERFRLCLISGAIGAALILLIMGLGQAGIPQKPAIPIQAHLHLSLKDNALVVADSASTARVIVPNNADFLRQIMPIWNRYKGVDTVIMVRVTFQQN